jgi:hypothetical protein
METSNTQQETAMKMEPQKEHQWLQRFIGEWTFEGEAMMEPDQPPSKFTWVYEGELDADERVLTLNAEGPSMASEGKMTQYKDVIEFKSDDHRVLTSHMLSDDGNWQQFMTANYWRKK